MRSEGLYVNEKFQWAIVRYKRKNVLKKYCIVNGQGLKWDLIFHRYNSDQKAGYRRLMMLIGR